MPTASTSPCAEVLRLPKERPLTFLRFLIKQRIVGFKTQSKPHFEFKETTAWFSEKLASSHRYLEFGAGGSTFLAAELHKPFVCVESDPYYLRAVKKRIKAAGLLDRDHQTFCHSSMGLTGPWGCPIYFGRPSKRKLRAFARYSEPPAICKSGGFRPDFVLVDGRFRVACALKTARFLGLSQDWTLAVDDYVDRPEYHVVETFLKLERRIGLMAVFTAPEKLDPKALDEAIARHETIPD